MKQNHKDNLTKISIPEFHSDTAMLKCKQTQNHKSIQDTVTQQLTTAATVTLRQNALK